MYDEAIGRPTRAGRKYGDGNLRHGLHQVDIRKAMDRSAHQEPQRRRQLGSKKKKGKAYFKFGAGRTYKSEELVILPVYFGSRKATMAIDIVDAKIPLLISLAVMKKAGTVIYTSMDVATICGEHIKLGKEGEYYTTSVRKGEAKVVKEDPKNRLKNDKTTDIEEGGSETPVGKGPESPKSWRKELWKLHNEMCRVTTRRTKAKLEREGVWRPEMEDILSEFEKRYKIDDCGPNLELEEIGDAEAEDKLAGKTGTGREAETRDEGNTKVNEEGKEDKVASKTSTGREERTWERRKCAEEYEGKKEIEQKGSLAAKATTVSTAQLGVTTRLTEQVEDTTRSSPMVNTEQERSQTAKATTRSNMWLGGMTRSTTQVGDETRSSSMPETEQDQSPEVKATIRPMTQLGGITRFIAQAGDTTRSFPTIETEQEGSQAAKDATRLTTQVGSTTRSTTEVGDMTKPITRMGSIMKSINGPINEHETHDRVEEGMLKDNEQSQFKKWDTNTWNELCLDDVESPRDFEKARFESIKRAGRILRKAKTSKSGDHNEAFVMIYEGGNYGKLIQANQYEEKCSGIHPISGKNKKFPRPSGFALVAKAKPQTSRGTRCRA